MGTTIEEVRGTGTEVVGLADKQTGNRPGETSGDTSATSTGDTGGGRTGRTEEPERTGTEPRIGTETEKEELSRLSLLNEKERKAYETADEKERKRLIKNAYKRKVYADNKATGQGTPKRTRKKKTDENLPLDTASLNMIIATVSAVIASRPGCEHWLLNEKEIESITTPLNNMIKESDAFKNIGTYSNQIALVSACITIFIPRLIITISKQKETKKIGVTGQKTNTQPGRVDGNLGKTQTSNPKDNRRNDREPTADSKNDGINVPWYASGILG